MLTMGGKSTVSSTKYALQLAHTLRRMAAVIALFTIVFAILAEAGLISRSPEYSLPVSVVISSFVVLFALWAYFKPFKTKSSRLAYFIIPFHAVGFALPILMTGYLSPITLFWLVLIVVTGNFLGTKAMLYSSSLLFLTAFASLALYENMPSSDFLILTLDHLIYAAVIVALAWFVGSMRTIHSTEHKDFVKAEQLRTMEQTRLLTLINSLNEAVVSINNSGIVQLYNAAVLNLLDTNTSLTGKHLQDVIAFRDSHGEPFNLLAALKKGSPSIVRDDLEYIFEDGEKMNVSVSTSRVRGNNNELLGYIIVLRDITHDKSLDEERDEFISVVSHELRTPITITEGTISNAELLLQKGATPNVIAGALRSAHEQILYLARMINDLGTLSRAERGVGSEKERIDVQEFIHEIFREYQPKAAKHNLALNLNIVGKPGYVKASRLYLEEIIQNFLTNAIKYTPEGSIDLSVKAHHGQVVFSVKDTGIGISKKEHAKIFEKFYRSEDYRTRETNGTGLGLYIVQKLARKLDTKIVLESRLNHGSIFSISLPLTNAIDTGPSIK